MGQFDILCGNYGNAFWLGDRVVNIVMWTIYEIIVGQFNPSRQKINIFDDITVLVNIAIDLYRAKHSCWIYHYVILRIFKKHDSQNFGITLSSLMRLFD